MSQRFTLGFPTPGADFRGSAGSNGKIMPQGITLGFPAEAARLRGETVGTDPFVLALAAG